MADDAAPAAAPAAAAAQSSAGLYSRHTVAGAAATAAAKPERTRAQEANEDNWKEFFDGTVSRFQTSLVIQAQLQQDYGVALQQQVTCSVNQGACSKCGLCLQDCRLVRHVEVIVIDIATCCTVQVPVVECSRCRMHAGRPYTSAAAASGVATPATADAVQQQQQQQWGPLNVHPFAFGCFPATPVHGVRLHLSQQSRSPVWFTMCLLQHWYGLRQHVQRLAVSKAAAAQIEHLQEGLLYSALPRDFSSDRFRKSFAAALDSYAALQHTVTQRQMLSLPIESVVGRCTVCRHGHEAFLEQEHVLTAGRVGSSGASACRCGSRADGTPSEDPAAAEPHTNTSAAATGAPVSGADGGDAAAAAAATTEAQHAHISSCHRSACQRR
ncbi:hypothetical protein COO60DRAFT_275426 [Scenedesmus sp. NREL 46B-D3]|nr:hypothetical protein COO60DRAFT_275426 [Scenedesmus sp. NREL 46B-D3]